MNVGSDTAVAVVLVVLLGVLYLVYVIQRGRRLLGRPGGVPLALRIDDDSWRLGVGRYAGNDLQWFGAFRLTQHPSEALRRGDLEVTGTRRRRPAEPMLPTDCIVVECRAPDRKVSLALSEAALTGFLSWLEASAPRA